MKLQPGSWGGGNQFGQTLVETLVERGVEVSFDLSSPDLDLIILAEPRDNLRISAYTDRDVLKYLRTVNSRAIVVHRVNECDERKGTTSVNRMLQRANLCSDHTVFVSNWLKDLHLRGGMRCKSHTVILNGSDRTLFNSLGYRRWNNKERLKLVSHHWSSHWMKGFDIYEELDSLLSSDHYRRRFSFTYIGNIPQGFRFRNSTYVKPTHGHALANLLASHHVYLTASQNEPGGHHQNEGASCGLPILYRESGCLPEYCEGFGVGFAKENFKQRLESIIEQYDYFAHRMADYPHSSQQTGEQYLDLFVELLSRRDEVIDQRRTRPWNRWLLEIRRLNKFAPALFRN